MGFRFRCSPRLGPLRFNYRFAGLQPPAGIEAMPCFLIAISGLFFCF